MRYTSGYGEDGRTLVLDSRVDVPEDVSLIVEVVVIAIVVSRRSRTLARLTIPEILGHGKDVRSRTCSKARPVNQKSLRPSRCAARSGRVRWYTAMRCGPGMSSSVASPFGNPNRWPNLTPRAVRSASAASRSATR